jgi:hypothetical protein
MLYPSSYRFGGQLDSFPHPEVDWPAFKRALDAAIARTPQTWCFVHRSMRPWITARQVSRLRPSKCVIS